METYKNLKKGTKVGLIFSMIFIVFGFGITAFGIFSTIGAETVKPTHMIHNAVDLLLYIATVFYVFIGYKKPHGNALKMLFIVFAVNIAVNASITSSGNDSVSKLIPAVCGNLAALTIAYVAGRLHKIETNRILLAIAGLFLLVFYLVPMLSMPWRIDRLFGCTQLLVLLATAFAYTARYEEHKAAGLADKADA